MVPKGKDVGGAFKSVPLCTGGGTNRLRHYLCELPVDCAAASELPLWRRDRCGHGGSLQQPRQSRRWKRRVAGISRRRRTDDRSAGKPRPWVTPEQKIDTPFVSVPALQNPPSRGKTCGLRAGSEKPGDRRAGSLVGIGRPRMERHCRENIEGQARPTMGPALSQFPVTANAPDHRVVVPRASRPAAIVAKSVAPVTP